MIQNMILEGQHFLREIQLIKQDITRCNKEIPFEEKIGSPYEPDARELLTLLYSPNMNFDFELVGPVDFPNPI